MQDPGLTKQFTPEEQAIFDIYDQIEAKNNRINEIDTIRRTKMFNAMSVKEKGTIKPVSISNNGGNYTDKQLQGLIDDGFNAFNSLTGAKGITGPKVKYSDLGRTAYDPGTKTILLAGHTGPDNVLHELGHWLEEQPHIKKEAQKFLKKRRGRSRAKRLSELTGDPYRDDELAWPDEFVHPYMGKKYTGGQTELVSLGLEYLLKKPLLLSNADPEMFEWLIGLLRSL